MGKGQSRRRRQANYLAAKGGGASQLAPPPTSKDLDAIPAKLRRIIKLKASSAPHVAKVDAHDSDINRRVDTKDKERGYGVKKQEHQLRSESETVSTSEGKLEKSQNDEHGSPSRPSERIFISKAKKRKRGESLHMLMEMLKATPVCKGISDHKKRYLEKKKKKNLRHSTSEETRGIYQQENIRFGDVVQAPPKLAPPKKLNMLSQERVRLQAVEAYRHRKGWLSRPGNHHPPFMSNFTLPGV